MGSDAPRTMDGHLILDRYRPLEVVGEGGFATVVLAWDTRMQRRVAIKRMPLPRDGATSENPAGLAEARTVALLSHPSIAAVYDFDTDSDEAFLIMEYVDGLSLADLLTATREPLTLDEVAAIVEDVGAALEFAHENGVLHLDLKPDNVLLTRDGRVKVTDFGIAGLSSLAGHAAAEGGTPGYMPLEQLLGHRVSARTDEWAFAATILELLCGENPYDAESMQAAIVYLESHEPPSLADLQPEYPLELSEALDVALAPHPEDRFEDVTALIDEILPHLGDAAAGRTSLRELVDEYSESLEDEEYELDRLGLWDRLRGRSGVASLRLTATAETAWLAWIGLSRLHLEPAALTGAIALASLAALLAPSLGIALGLGCLVIGAAASGWWVASAIVLLVGTGWWWFVARHGDGASVLPLTGPALGVVHASPLQPILAGFSLLPLKAAATALAGGILTMLAAAISYRARPYLDVDPRLLADIEGARLGANAVMGMLRDPGSWIALAGWPLAGAAMSIACARATRLAAAAGALCCTAILTAAYILAEEVSRAPWFDAGTALSLGVSLILGLLVVFLGPPLRAEEE